MDAEHKPWVVNDRERRIHHRRGADERCNLDDAEDLRRATTEEMTQLVREGYEMCKWCLGD